jgi:cellulose synthase/poly-beta-1,6-N-acetylglucosamine synthase-like glycosyltransferase
MIEGCQLSVVIPTIGRPILVRTLRSVLACRGGASLDVIVVGSIGDPAVLREVDAIRLAHANVRHFAVSWPDGDSSRKKNHGMAESRCDLVAFLDDDVTVAPDWPAHILEAFKDPSVGLVSGPSLVPEDINLSGRLAGLVLSSRAAGYAADRYRTGDAAPRVIGWNRVIGCNAAYRKCVFETMGGFPPEFYPGEEMIAAWRTQQLGHKLLFIPASWVLHYPRQSVARFWRQIWGYGATRIRLYRAGVEMEWAALVPGAWVLSLLLLGVAVPFWTVAALLLALDLGLYAAAAAAVTLETVWRTRRWRDLLLFFMIPVMHLSYGVAEWVELMRPNSDFGERKSAAVLTVRSKAGRGREDGRLKTEDGGLKAED